MGLPRQSYGSPIISRAWDWSPFFPSTHAPTVRRFDGVRLGATVHWHRPGAPSLVDTLAQDPRSRVEPAQGWEVFEDPGSTGKLDDVDESKSKSARGRLEC